MYVFSCIGHYCICTVCLSVFIFIFYCTFTTFVVNKRIRIHFMLLRHALYWPDKSSQLNTVNTVNECQINFGFLPAKYQISIRNFAVINFCRRLLHQKIAYARCLLVTRSSSYVAYSCNSRKIFKLHVTCTMPFIAIFSLIINVPCTAFAYSSSFYFSYVIQSDI